MQTLLFSIRNLDRLHDVLANVHRALRPRAVEPLYPGTKVPSRATEYFVALDDQTDLEDLANRLREVPDVCDVELPVERKLVR